MNRKYFLEKDAPLTKTVIKSRIKLSAFLTQLPDTGKPSSCAVEPKNIDRFTLNQQRGYLAPSTILPH